MLQNCDPGLSAVFGGEWIKIIFHGALRISHFSPINYFMSEIVAGEKQLFGLLVPWCRLKGIGVLYVGVG